MWACSGTWIAHRQRWRPRRRGQRTDRVAPAGRVRVPVAPPLADRGAGAGLLLRLRQRGLWPLCHVAHVRPVFREQDWEHYRNVNQLFADAVVAEARSEDLDRAACRTTTSPCCPRWCASCRARPSSPSGTSPWPNPESFGICPWRSRSWPACWAAPSWASTRASTCKNFIETVDRYMEARIEHEHSIISFGGEETLVESYPISIEWPCWRRRAPPPRAVPHRTVRTPGHPARPQHRRGRGPLRLHQGHPGAPERGGAHAGETSGVGERFTFVQVAAPRAARSRSTAPSRSGSSAPPSASTRKAYAEAPVIRLLVQHHDHDAVMRLYRAADVHGDQPARRHEPGVQEQLPRRRARRAGPQPLRRRRARDAGGAGGQSLPRGGDRRRVVQRVDHAAGGAARTHGHPAAPCRSSTYRWAGRMLADAARLRLRLRVSERAQRHRGDQEEACPGLEASQLHAGGYRRPVGRGRRRRR